MFESCHAAAMADSAPPWRHRPTLADRAEITRRIEAERAGKPAAAPAEEPDGERRAGEHCWVLDPHGTRTAGLVLEWRRQGGRWIALTAFVAERDDGRNELAEAWVDAAQLRRITSAR
jgi:hypothetical protein